MRPIARLGLGLALLGVATGLFLARGGFILSFFPRATPTATGAPSARVTPPPGDPIRVVVLDGLGREMAQALPHLSALCRRGLDLAIDVGFPTVSLPVQAVLWTGLTQQQSGVEYVGVKLAEPLDGIPARVPGSIALAESHAFIVESLGFAATRPLPAQVDDEAARAAWEGGGFRAAALAAVAADAPLVLLHVLRIDDAGHRHGGASPEYAAAARAADDLVGALVAAAPDAGWLVLSDHGHRAAGGHGDGEPAIRIVRGCLTGAVAAGHRAPPGHLVHLTDVARALGDALGVGLAPAATGRPLAVALGGTASPGATLPSPPPRRTAIAVLLLAAGAVTSIVAARRTLARLPWWLPLSYASVVLLEGAPTLSMRMVFAPVGQAMILAALPGLALLAIVGGRSTASEPLRLTVAQLALPLAALLACLALCARVPPLVPIWSAHASLLFVLCASGALVVGLALLAALVPGWFDRSRARGTRRAPP